MTPHLNSHNCVVTPAVVGTEPSLIVINIVACLVTNTWGAIHTGRPVLTHREPVVAASSRHARFSLGDRLSVAVAVTIFATLAAEFGAGIDAPLTLCGVSPPLSSLHHQRCMNLVLETKRLMV